MGLSNLFNFMAWSDWESHDGSESTNSTGTVDSTDVLSLENVEFDDDRLKDRGQNSRSFDERKNYETGLGLVFISNVECNRNMSSCQGNVISSDWLIAWENNHT